jgi:hypothetical protein
VVQTKELNEVQLLDQKSGITTEMIDARKGEMIDEVIHVKINVMVKKVLENQSAPVAGQQCVKIAGQIDLKKDLIAANLPKMQLLARIVLSKHCAQRCQQRS